MSEYLHASDELKGIVEELGTLIARGRSPEVEQPLNAVQTAADEVGKAWSGSWIGHHSRVYYGDLKPPPPGAHFNSEWGLMSGHIGSSTGDWHEYDYEEVVGEIFSIAGNPKLDTARRAAAESAKLFDAKRDQIVSILETASQRDGFLDGLLEKTKSAKLIWASDIVAYQRPSQVMSRDRPAMSQGVQTPPHIAVLSDVLEIRAHIRACETMSDVASKAAAHLERLARRSTRDARIGTNVFIGHGRSKVWKDLKDFIQDRLRLPWDEFNRVPVAGVTNIARLSEMLDAAAIAFVVMTAEDELADGTAQARMNVIHEAGLFQGRLGFTRAIVLLEEGCEEFANIHGLGQIRFPKGNISAIFEEVRRVLEREGLIEG